ncbi:hypothetical protein BBP40_012174 [Aspergillus hancockii]|nr:hypothetical protein BBP40_012174 [Aspergillus hancockii]
MALPRVRKSPNGNLKPFSVDVKGGQGIYEGVLVRARCTLAMVYLKDLTQATFEEVGISVVKPKFEIISIGPFKDKEFASTQSHSLYCVTLINEEVWAIDAAGAQFGSLDPLRTWGELIEH